MTRHYTLGFSGGEMSPGMFGLVSDAEFRRGVEKSRNAIVLPQGGLRRRGGTRISASIKDSAHRARVVRFRFSDDQACAVEMGHGYIRLHANGAPVLAVPRAYTASATVTFNAGTDLCTWPGAHNLVTGDPVQFTGGTMPTAVDGNLASSTTYYAEVVSPTTHKLRRTANATSAIDLTSGGAGTITGHRLYELGYVVVSGGTNYYCTAQHVNIAPPSAGTWYAMPVSGVLEIPASRFTDDNLFEITFAQSNDVMTFAHRDFESLELRRYSNERWVAASVVYANTLAAPTGLVVTADPGVTQDFSAITFPGGAGTDLQFATNSPHGLAAGVSTVRLVDGSGAGAISGYVRPGGVVLSDANNVFRVGKVIDPFQFWLCKMVGGANLKEGTDTTGVYTTLTLGFVEVNPTAETSARYVVTAVNSDGIESQPSSAVTATNNLDAQGAKNTLTWNAVVGARRYYVYREESGLFGFVGQVESDPATGFAAAPFVDDSINPDFSRTVPTFDSTLSADEHPGAVGYFQGRRWFAATQNLPQDVWGTRSGTESDLSFHIPVVDSDRIYFRAALRELAVVRHIVPAQHLLLLTSSGELRITPRSGDVLVPSGIDARPQSYVGASYVTPQVQGQWIVFAAERGGRVWATSYNLAGDGFIPADLSVRAAHLFAGATLVDSAMSRSPHPTVWFTNSLGRVLGCTFMPEQNVHGWFYLDTNGTIESIADVPEGDEDRLYAVIRRGSTRYIERFEPVADATRAAGLFLDAAVTVTSGTTVAVPHPNGTSLDALIDGVVYRDLVVAGGNVTLPKAPVSVAHVGLRYRTHIVTLPLALSIEGYAQGRQMNASRATPRVRQTGSCSVGPSTTSLVQLFRDDSLTLHDGFASQLVNPQWDNHGQLHIVQDDPLPVEVTSLTLEVAVGGE